MSEEERQDIKALLGEFREFRGEIHQYVKAQDDKCRRHNTMFEAAEERMSSLELSREYAKGWIKAIGIGAPAVGSLAWAMIELGKFLKGLKGGG